MSSILVTGATGTVGRAVVRRLLADEHEVRAAARHPGSAAGLETVAFDFTSPATWPAAFRGIESMFLVRPPQIGNVRRDMLPALEAARNAGVRHVVFLSLQGIERIPVMPHATAERWLRKSGMSWTFVRASFFMQNLSGAHAADLREHDAIIVPAGNGRTALVDAEDIAAVATAALLDPVGHRNRAWTPTGPAALTYAEVAAILTEVLGRPIRYTRPGVRRYWRHTRRDLHQGVGAALVTTVIYTVARLGLAAGLTDDVRAVTGQAPTPFRAFAERERAAWTQTHGERNTS